VFVAGDVFFLSTLCVCAFQGFVSGLVFTGRTTRRQGLGRFFPNWVGWAVRVVTFGGAAGEDGDSTFPGVVAVR